MDKRQVKIFSIYSPEDVQVIDEMARTMDEEGISFERYFDNPNGTDWDYERLVENADLVLVLASDHSRRDVLCCQCVKLAHDLNKNIVCVGYHKGGLFNRQSWVQDEWSLRTDIFAWLDMNSRAVFLAHMRGACGLETLEGDLVGARVTFSNHTDLTKCPYSNFMLYRKEGRNEWNKIVDRVQSSEDITIRLRRGDYYYCLYSSDYPKRVSTEKSFSVKNDSDHKHFMDDLSAKMDQFISHARKCAETKHRYQRLIDKNMGDLSRTIRDIDERKWNILGRKREIVWTTPLVRRIGLVVALLFAVIGALSYVQSSSSSWTLDMLAIFAFPMTIFLYTSMFSILSILSCLALSVFASLVFYGGVSMNKQFVKCLASVFVLKIACMLLLDSLHLYPLRGVLLGGFVGFSLTFVGYWAIQALKSMYWSKTSGFRIDYWNYRQVPYTANYNLLAKKGAVLNSLGDMSPERLERSDDDQIMQDEVVVAMDRYESQPIINLSLTDFPLGSLIMTILKLSIIFIVLLACIIFAVNFADRIVEWVM